MTVNHNNNNTDDNETSNNARIKIHDLSQLDDQKSSSKPSEHNKRASNPHHNHRIQYEHESASRNPNLNSSQSKSTNSTQNSTSFKFGYASYKPTWLQHVNRSPILLLALCICAICQGSIVNGFISTSISSLEKRFNLSSTQSGIFSAFYDIAVVLVLIPLSHFGNKCHKGRVIATGMVLVAIGSFLLILPHFLAGNYTVGEEHHNVCLNDNYNNNNNHKQQHSFSTADDVNSCSADDHTNSVNSIWFYILLSSQLFIGIGAAPLFTLGISYLDENVSQNSVTLYLGIYMAMSTVGPAIGFIVGGQLLKIWGDIGKTDYRDLNISGTTDPRWYGAWWIGFAVAAILSILSAIPLFGFPKELPERQRHRLKDVKQTHKDLDRKFGKSLLDFPKIVMSLLSNASVMALIAMQTCEAFLMNGLITFIPKVFENIFSYSASFSSTITGIIVVPMGLFGSLFGAYMAKRTLRFQPTILLAIIFNIFALCLSFVFFDQCEQRPFAGVTYSYTGSSLLHNNNDNNNNTSPLKTIKHLESSCNRNCHCSSTAYDPVCNTQIGVTYYSACYAGCTSQSVYLHDNHDNEKRNDNSMLLSAHDNEQWTSCACVAQWVTNDNNNNNITNNNSTTIFSTTAKRNAAQQKNIQVPTLSVQKGLCKGDCSQIFFFVIFALLCFFTFGTAIPIQNASLRVVSFDTRDVAIGLTWLFMRIFGSIPGAIIFGFAIDRTCILWKEECGVQQSCLRYDSYGLSRSMVMFAIGIKAMIIFFLSISYYFYKHPDDNIEQNDNEQLQNDKEFGNCNKVQSVVLPSSSENTAISSQSKPTTSIDSYYLNEMH